jgi:hypothetical protein
MHALKALVIFMGMLIVLGMGLFAWGISTKLGEMAETGEAALPVTLWEAPVDVAIPPGARVIETRVEDGRLAVSLLLTNGDSRILLFDLKTGQRIGAIRLNQSEGAQ